MFLALPFRKAEYIHVGLLNNFTHIMTNTNLSITFIAEILIKSKVSEGTESNTSIIAVLLCAPSPLGQKGFLTFYSGWTVWIRVSCLRKRCNDNLKRPRFRFTG